MPDKVFQITPGCHSSGAGTAGHFLAAARRDAFADPLCAQIRDLQRKRRFYIATINRHERATDSHLLNVLGGDGLPKGERKKIFDRAARLREIMTSQLVAWDETASGAVRHKAAAKAETLSRSLTERERDALASESNVLRLCVESGAIWKQLRRGIEKEMERLARKLPAWTFVDSVLGVGALGLAVIVGEAGDPTAYRDKHTLFKRLGIGVVDGKRQGDPSICKTADDWVRHGANKQRKAEIYTFFYDSMLRQQWAAAKTDDEGNVIVPAHPKGSYGVTYERYKAVYVERGHPYADRVARRRMAQEFIRDVRNAWRDGQRVIAGETPADRCPPSPAIAITDEAA